MVSRKTQRKRVRSKPRRTIRRRRRERAGAKTPGAPSKKFRGWVRGATIQGSAGPAFGSSGQHSIQPLSLFDPGMMAELLESREVAAPAAVRVVRSPKVYPARNAYGKLYGTEADMLAEALKTLKLGKKQTRGSKAKKKEGKKPASRKPKASSRKQSRTTMDMDALRKALASLESKSGDNE